MNFPVPPSTNGQLNTLLLWTAVFFILALFLGIYFFTAGAPERGAMPNEGSNGYVVADPDPLLPEGEEDQSTEKENEAVELLVTLKRGTDAAALAKEHGLILKSTLRSDPNSHLFEADSLQAGKEAREALSTHPNVSDVYFNEPAYNQPLEP